MANEEIDRRRHLLLTGTSAAEPYTSPQQGGGETRLPPVNPAKLGGVCSASELRDKARLASNWVRAARAARPRLDDHLFERSGTMGKPSVSLPSQRSWR